MYMQITMPASSTDLIEAVYIHIPFCVKKCNYCDFLSFSHGTNASEVMKQYIQALIVEMQLAAERYTVKAKTIFVGGGTPSVLSEDLLEKLLSAVQQYFVTECLQEYTVELNPGTITSRKLQVMKQYGVSRLSIGVQSDNEAQLCCLVDTALLNPTSFCLWLWFCFPYFFFSFLPALCVM